jgi:hypothetical protein
MEAILKVDDVRPVLAAIRERGVRIDPMFAGECRQLFGNPGTRMQYSRRDGLRIDDVAELLYDRDFTTRRITTVECIDLLEQLFTPSLGTGTSVSREDKRELEDAKACARAIEVRRKTRLRLYECEACGKKLRVADDELSAFHRHTDPDTLESTMYAFVLKTPKLNALPF